MRGRRPNAERPDQTDLVTVCDNPSCEREHRDGYISLPHGVAVMASEALQGAAHDGWLRVDTTDACSWDCLAVIAANRAEAVPV